MTTADTSPTGPDAIRRALAAMPEGPGVYRMLDVRGEPLYIGKARALKNRVGSYVNVAQLPLRLQRMVMATQAMEITVTRSEAEALLLEASLIKSLKPRYNILLRDDKSFPYIRFTGGHAYPRIEKYRGAKSEPGEYFGPYVSAGSVNETLALLQKAFRLRPCADSVFRNRTRPCLQYQIKRCSGPCVGLISPEEYGALAEQARRFLAGESRAIQDQLTHEMEAASARLDYEQAGVLRDRLRALNTVQQEGAASADIGDADLFALAEENGQACVQAVCYRGGLTHGHRAYFPAHAEGRAPEEVLSAFLGQYYQHQGVPPLILVSHVLRDAEVLKEALGSLAGRKVEIAVPQRGERAALMRQALRNARENAMRRKLEAMRQEENLARLAELFGLSEPPSRIEIYDNSHVMGTNAVGAMVVAGPEGFARKAYRMFNIRSQELAPGDDYAMLREVLTRRFKRMLAAEGEEGWGSRPDLLLIDGGAGQLTAARQAMEELGVAEIPLAAIAKGPERNAGREWFHLPGREPFQLPAGDAALHYLQTLRDEAHRFAIGAHRKRRSRAATGSELDAVGNIGPARKKALLHHFGSAKAVGNASLEEIAQVPGISRALAAKIYGHFHG